MDWTSGPVRYKQASIGLSSKPSDPVSHDKLCEWRILLWRILQYSENEIRFHTKAVEVEPIGVGFLDGWYSNQRCTDPKPPRALHRSDTSVVLRCIPGVGIPLERYEISDLQYSTSVNQGEKEAVRPPNKQALQWSKELGIYRSISGKHTKPLSFFPAIWVKIPQKPSPPADMHIAKCTAISSITCGDSKILQIRQPNVKKTSQFPNLENQKFQERE